VWASLLFGDQVYCLTTKSVGAADAQADAIARIIRRGMKRSTKRRDRASRNPRQVASSLLSALEREREQGPGPTQSAGFIFVRPGELQRPCFAGRSGVVEVRGRP